MDDGAYVDVESGKGRRAILVPRGLVGRPLSHVLRHAGLPLNTRCGERGRCDGCVIELVSGGVTHVRTGESVAADGAVVSVHGCQYRLGGGRAGLRIPVRSALAYEPQVVTEFNVNVSAADDPPWQQVELTPTRAGEVGDAEAQLRSALGARWPVGRAVQVTAAALEKFACLRGRSGLWATMQYQGEWWSCIDVVTEPCTAPLGVAIDVGTTTVALLLVELRSGKIRATAAEFNQQLQLGDDVVTRITLCADKGMIATLQEALTVRTLAPLLASALRQAGAMADQVVCGVVAANTTMLHLLAGVDPSPLGVVPFTPVFLEHRALEAAALPGWPGDGYPRAAMHLLPGAAAYIGADLTAGVLASGLLYDPGPSLLVDAGTNGEIILKNGGQLLGCATAAGPAFEGSGLSCGIRAGDGAIAHVRLGRGGSVENLEIIGGPGVKAAGLCGSAYIDFLAEGRRCGILTATGRLDTSVPGLNDRLVRRGNELAFRVARGEGGRDIVVSEADVGRLLPAKGAIAAGVLTLLEHAGVTPGQVRKVYLAGGFGTHMDAGAAIACGLLPGFEVAQIQSVGNTALAGAYLALLDSSTIPEMATIGRGLEVIELNLDPKFEDRYIEQLSLA